MMIYIFLSSYSIPVIVVLSLDLYTDRGFDTFYLTVGL